MNEAAHKEPKERIGVEVWRWLVGLFAGLLLGMITGQFVPNRNIVTTDQLNAAVAPLIQKADAQSTELENVNSRLADLTGQLKAQKLVQGN